MRRLLLVALLFLASRATSAGVVLEASTDSLEVVTVGSTVSLDYNCSWSDNTSSAFTPGKSAGNIASATTTTVVAAPAASTQRNIMNCTFRNTNASIANTLTLQRDISATNRTMYTGVVAAGETLLLTQEGEFRILNANGIPRTQAAEVSGYSGRNYGYMKPGGAKDSAGYWYAYGKDAGMPGASVPGAPGVNGWNTDCSAANNAANPAGAAQVGANMLPNPATGGWYLTQAPFATSTAEVIQLIDIVWYDTGLAVAAGAQAIAAPGGLGPARDVNGSTNGENYGIGILVLTTLGNAAAIATSTATYTDSEGNAGNTATLQALVGMQVPATAVLGTFVPMQLAAGDRGARTITSWNTGTTYTSGTYALVLYRVLATIPAPVANVAGNFSSDPMFSAPGIRLWNGTCVVAVTSGPATATTLIGSYSIMER